jgi:DNA-directed RNA polymerase specialized sigma24 family protein
VARYGGRLAARARQALAQCGFPRGSEQVEEVVQEVYCRLLAGGGQRLTACRAASEGQVVSYLGRVVERVVFDQGRSERALKRGGGWRGRLAGAEAWTLAHRQIDPDGTPEDQLLAVERCRLILAEWRDMGRKTAGRRNLRILRLALVEGRSSREIAEILGALSPSTVDTVIHRLRRHLSSLGLALPRRSRVLGEPPPTAEAQPGATSRPAGV